MPQTKELRSESHARPKSQTTVRIDKLEEIGVCYVLTKAIERLRIIKRLLPELESEEHEPYVPMVTRMTTLQKITPPENQEDGSTVALKHIQTSCLMTKHAMERVVQGYKGSEGMLYSLKQIILSENRRYYDNFLLKQENLNLNNTIRNLKDRINEVKRNTRETRVYLDKMTQFCLQQAATTAWAQSQTLKKNTEVFQQARVDQNNYRLRDREDRIASQSEQCAAEVAKEDLISNEITTHLQTVTDALQKKFEKWTARYSEEVDALDIALLQLRSKMEEQQEKFGTMSEQHSSRQEVVDVLQAEADERDKEQEMRLALTKASLIIQQWWRKVMQFRHVHKSANASASKKGNKGSAKKSRKDSPKKKKK